MKTTDYIAAEYTLEHTTGNGNHFFLDVESVHRMGILRATHEATIYFIIEDGKIIFDGAWETAHGEDWSYKKGEQAQFEEDHPGLLGHIEKAFLAHRVNYLYYVWDGKRNNPHTTKDIEIALMN